MIALLENEFVEKKKYIEKDEFLDMVAIAESTPGPIAINAATYIGYKRSGFWGAIAAISNNEEILKELNLPSGFIPCCSVCLGHTNEVFEKREIPERIAKTYIK